jgi:hypothetical protein
MTTRERIFAEITAERGRQDEKWGEQNHPLTFPGSYRTPEFWHDEAQSWKQTNDRRVAKATVDGAPADRNCAWDSILEEEVAEAFGSPRPGLQYAEFVQAAGVAVNILELLNRRCFEQTGHLAGCPALDVDWVVTAPEACDCDSAPWLFEARVWSTGSRSVPTTYGVWDRSLETWKLEGDLTKETAEREARRLNAEAKA